MNQSTWRESTIHKDLLLSLAALQEVDGKREDMLNAYKKLLKEIDALENQNRTNTRVIELYEMHKGSQMNQKKLERLRKKKELYAAKAELFRVISESVGSTASTISAESFFSEEQCKAIENVGNLSTYPVVTDAQRKSKNVFTTVRSGLLESREMLTANDDQIGVTHKDVLDCYYEIKELDTVEIKHMDDPSTCDLELIRQRDELRNKLAELREKRKIDYMRALEEKVTAELKCVAEEKQAAEAKRLADEKRAVNEKQAAEAKRLADEKCAAEKKQAAEVKRLANEKRAAEEKQAAEAKRLADEKRAAEEKQAAEGKRLVDERAFEEKVAAAPNRGDGGKHPDDKKPAVKAENAAIKRPADVEERVAKAKRAIEKRKAKQHESHSSIIRDFEQLFPNKPGANVNHQESVLQKRPPNRFFSQY